ncbi:MAG TPA: hypothetical protein VJK54_07615 [Chthoniobacterales bacterium]|nr:hypothetical protein [Chthoniobacterales bacterium]
MKIHPILAIALLTLLHHTTTFAMDPQEVKGGIEELKQFFNNEVHQCESSSSSAAIARNRKRTYEEDSAKMSDEEDNFENPSSRSSSTACLEEKLREGGSTHRIEMNTRFVARRVVYLEKSASDWAGKAAYFSAEYQVKAYEAEENGRKILATGYKEVALMYQQAADHRKLAAEAYAARESWSIGFSWDDAGKAFQLQADYHKKAIEAREARKEILAIGYEEVAATARRAAEKQKESALAKISNKIKEGSFLYLEGRSIQSQAYCQVKAIEAGEAGKAILAAGYREVAATYQCTADQWEKGAETFASGEQARWFIWQFAANSLEQKAIYQEKLIIAQDAEKEALVVGYQEVIEIFQSSSEYYQQALAAFALEKEDEGAGWKNIADFLALKAKNKIKTVEETEQARLLYPIGLETPSVIQQLFLSESKNNISIMPSADEMLSTFFSEELSSSSFCSDVESVAKKDTDVLSTLAMPQEVSFQKDSNLEDSMAFSRRCKKWIEETQPAEGSGNILSDYMIDILKRGVNYHFIKDFETYRGYVLTAYEQGDYPLASAWIQVAEDMQQALEYNIKHHEFSKKFCWDWHYTCEAMQKMAGYRAEYIKAAISQTPEIITEWKKIVEESQSIANNYRKVAEASSFGNLEEPNRCDNNISDSIRERASKLEKIAQALRHRSMQLSGSPN